MLLAYAGIKCGTDTPVGAAERHTYAGGSHPQYPSNLANPVDVAPSKQAVALWEADELRDVGGDFDGAKRGEPRGEEAAPP
jgi:hypothetical protein